MEFLLYSRLIFTKKTLTLLNLQYNQIGDIGAEYLTDFLKHNKVIIITSASFLFILTFNFLFQTLTELNLEENNIGDVGAHHLAKMLETNQVIFILLKYFCRFLFLLHF